jgi:hypothetical protein
MGNDLGNNIDPTGGENEPVREFKPSSNIVTCVLNAVCGEYETVVYPHIS